MRRRITLPIPPAATTAAAAVLPILAVAALLAGCERPQGHPPPGVPYGEAVQRNVALQVIDPEPELAPVPPEFDGARAALMIERYRTDEVEAPEGLGAAPDIGILLEEVPR